MDREFKRMVAALSLVEKGCDLSPHLIVYSNPHSTYLRVDFDCDDPFSPVGDKLWKLGLTESVSGSPWRMRYTDEFIGELKAFHQFCYAMRVFPDVVWGEESMSMEAFIERIRKAVKEGRKEKLSRILKTRVTENNALKKELDQWEEETQKTLPAMVEFCFETLHQLFVRIDKGMLKKYASLCTGTIRKSDYCEELAQMKIATDKIIRYTPELAKFADKVQEMRDITNRYRKGKISADSFYRAYNYVIDSYDYETLP